MRRRLSSQFLLQQAFSLIELMVVLVILGIVTAVAVLSISSGGNARHAKDAANRLQIVLQAAMQQALLQAAPIGFYVTSNSYRFLTYENQAWRPMSQQLFQAHQLSSGLHFTLQVNHKDVATKNSPALLFTSAGVPIPFVVRFISGSRVYSQLIGQSDGSVQIRS